jgi:hypothetical protein
MMAGVDHAVAASGVRAYQGGTTMKKLASVLVLLAGVGTGRADDKAILAELDKAGVKLIEARIVSFKNVRGTNALLDRVADLSNIHELVLWLEGSDLTDEGLATLGCRLKGLYALELKGTVVTDKGLKTLTGLPLRYYLGLSGCVGVTDEGLNSIARLKGLKAVELNGTGVTKDGVARLRKALPDCEIRFGKQ